MTVDGLRIPRPLLRHELQRDLPVEARVLGLPDHTHPALADLLDQAVVQNILAGFDGQLPFSTFWNAETVYPPRRVGLATTKPGEKGPSKSPPSPDPLIIDYKATLSMNNLY